MKLSHLLLAGAAVLSTSLIPLAAIACDEGSTYQGGGYTVTIGSEGNYYGCNSKNQCLEISQYSHQSRGQYIWENKGTTYSMTPISGKKYPYRLKVIGSRGQVLVNQLMKPAS